MLPGEAVRTGEDVLVLSNFVGVTPRSQSVDRLLLRRCEELAEFLGEEPPVEEGASAEDLEQAFAPLLRRAALESARPRRWRLRSSAWPGGGGLWQPGHPGPPGVVPRST